MPGFTTHYLFGVDTYKGLAVSNLKQAIYRHPTAYGLGLQGPDVFFYYPLSYLKGHNIGTLAHTEKSGEFLKHLAHSRTLFHKKEEQETANAYIAGFFGHYLLDCKCHPYVYAKSRFTEESPAYYGKHINLETDINTALLQQKKGIHPSAFSQSKTIRLSKGEKRVVAKILYSTYTNTFPERHFSYYTMRAAIDTMYLGTMLLKDKTGQKRVLFRKAEALFAGHPFVSCMIGSDSLVFFRDPMNLNHKDWENPWDTSFSSNASIPELLDEAGEEYRRALDFFDSGNEDELLNTLGNRSYHSGLPI
jgi:hypothetical protein